MSKKLDSMIDATFDRSELLAEAIETVKYADLDLGSDTPAKSIDRLKTQAIELLQKFDAEKASFAPILQVHRLAKAELKIAEDELSPDLKAKMRRYYFYKIDIPITLISNTGWAFTRLLCRIDFSPGGEEIKQLPTIHDMFPTDEWQDILKFQDQLILGLDENLAFRAEVEKMEGQWKKLSGDVQAKLALQVGGGAKLALGPFSYNLRRAKVKSRGRGNVKGAWQLDGTDFVDEEDVQLGVILMIPKNREQPVNAIGALKANHNFQLWTADVFKDFRRYFGSAIKAFIEGGAVITATQAWENITG